MMRVLVEDGFIVEIYFMEMVWSFFEGYLVFVMEFVNVERFVMICEVYYLLFYCIEVEKKWWFWDVVKWWFDVNGVDFVCVGNFYCYW